MPSDYNKFSSIAAMAARMGLRDTTRKYLDKAGDAFDNHASDWEKTVEEDIKRNELRYIAERLITERDVLGRLFYQLNISARESPSAFNFSNDFGDPDFNAWPQRALSVFEERLEEIRVPLSEEESQRASLAPINNLLGVASKGSTDEHRRLKFVCYFLLGFMIGPGLWAPHNLRNVATDFVRRAPLDVHRNDHDVAKTIDGLSDSITKLLLIRYLGAFPNLSVLREPGVDTYWSDSVSWEMTCIRRRLRPLDILFQFHFGYPMYPFLTGYEFDDSADDEDTKRMSLAELDRFHPPKNVGRFVTKQRGVIEQVIIDKNARISMYVKSAGLEEWRFGTILNYDGDDTFIGLRFTKTDNSGGFEICFSGGSLSDGGWDLSTGFHKV